MSDWSKVGQWLQDNAAKGAALVGSLVSGNVPGAIAAGVSMISSATGTTDPQKALQAFQADPATVLKLQEMANQKEEDIRQHLEAMEKMRLDDAQASQTQTQETIRSGDNASDIYVRHTRPKIARESWYATIAYGFLCAIVKITLNEDIFVMGIATMFSLPWMTYMGVRTADKVAVAFGKNPISDQFLNAVSSKVK